MSRALKIFVAAVMGCGYWASVSQAQDSGSQSKRTPSIGERLEAIVIGDPKPSRSRSNVTTRRPGGSDSANASTQGSAGNRAPSRVTKSNVPTPAVRDAASEETSEGADDQTETSSKRLTSQPDFIRARKAQPNAKNIETDESDAPLDDPAEERIAKRSERSARLTKTPSLQPAVRPLDPSEAEEAKQEAIPSKPVPAPNEGVLFVSSQPQLEVEAIGPRRVMIGKECIFEIKLRNRGDVTANDVKVAMHLPASVEVANSQATSGTAHGTLSSGAVGYEWQLPQVEGNSRQTLTLHVIPHKGTPIEMGLNWTCAQEVQQATVEVQEPKLAMNLSGPADVLYGESKLYKLLLSNPGSGEAENVLVVLSPMGKGTEGSASHRVGTLKPGESRTIEVELTAREAGELMIKAQATAEGGLRAEAAEHVLVRRANLAIEVKAPKKQFALAPASYNVVVTNSGNAVADQVHVTVALPPEAKFLTASAGGKLTGDRSAVEWFVPAMQPNTEKQFDLKCLLQTPGDNLLQVTALGAGELVASNSAATQVEAVADLKLEIRDPQGPIAVGEDAVYEVVVKNRGMKSADSVQVRAYFSEGLEAMSVQGGVADVRTGKGEVIFEPIATIAGGSEVILRIHTKAERPGNHVFHAQVVCHPLLGDNELAARQNTLFYGDEAPATEVAAQPKRSGTHREYVPSEESDSDTDSQRY